MIGRVVSSGAVHVARAHPSVPHHVVVHLTLAHAGAYAVLEVTHELVHLPLTLLVAGNHQLELAHFTSTVTVLESVTGQLECALAFHSGFAEARGELTG